MLALENRRAAYPFRVYGEAIVSRLQRHYAGDATPPDRDDGEILSLALLQLKTTIY